MILTIPNLISLLRLLGAPLVIWLDQNGNFITVVFILILASASDYFDGKLARALKQQSRLGELLDPTTDRIYIAALLYLLWSSHLFPFWLISMLVTRDLLLLLLNALLKARKLPLMRVTFMGKAATFNLLYALPLIYLSKISSPITETSWILGWAFAIWGAALYLISGFRYFRSALKTIRFPSGLIVN